MIMSKKELSDKALEKIKVKCPLCKDLIPANALRCSHCAGDLTDASVKAKIDEQVAASQKHSKVFVAILLIFIFWMIISVSSNSSTPHNYSSSSAQAPTHKTLGTGEQGVLRMGSDPTQIVLLATTETAFDTLTKTLMANDTTGILELSSQGAIFGVTNGSKVLVIDRSYGKRKVRIIEGVRPIDTDKVGLSGWVPMEWVVAN